MTVENNGEPIDTGLRERLLQRGVRGDERVEGHGLGLTIVTELVSAYGGEIKIDRSELGGALFKITIPPA
jgi:two-component system sensor histidine kinase PhoQ